MIELRIGSIDLLVDAQRSRRRASLEESLRTAIQTGRLLAGQPLPSTRSLAEDLGWSRGTVAAAYDQLVTEGYLHARPGAGVTVAGSGRAPELPHEQQLPDRRLDLYPGAPNVAGFPVQSWLRATNHAIRSAPASALEYPDGRGDPTLRATLRGYLGRTRGIDAVNCEVVIGSGTTHLVWVLARSVAQQGGTRIAVEDPSHPNLRAAVADTGLQIVALPVDESGARIDTLDVTSPDAVLVTPAHQYPTGVVLSPERRLQLIAWARRRGALVIEDDYDGELRYDRKPVAAMQGMAPDVIAYVGSASKTLAPGLRIGWAAVPRPYAEAAAQIIRTVSWGIDVVGQLALAAFIDLHYYDRQVRLLRARYQARHRSLRDALSSIPGARLAVHGIQAGGHGLVYLPDRTVENDLIEAGHLRELNLFGLADHWQTPRAEPGGIVVGLTRLSDRSWPIALAEFMELLRLHFDC